MPTFLSPALTAWISRVTPEFVWAEVWARRTETGIELRHQTDAAEPAERLQTLSPSDLLVWSQTDARGAFRPNRTAPGLRPGWRVTTRDATTLETALEGLYPGAVADWYAVATGAARPAPFREFTGRQTGMYRGIGRLDDAAAASVVRAGCDAVFCLRCRVWPAPGLEADSGSGKSAIPCLEPCALLLEFSRQAARAASEGSVAVTMEAADRESLIAALDRALDPRDPGLREGDFTAPLNPRRLLRLRHRLNTEPSGAGKTSEEG